jgi:hypothetical protein
MTRDSNSPMNALMRGQKAARDRQVEGRQARFFTTPPEDRAADVEAEARIARREADVARAEADAATARQEADDAAARLAAAEGR